MDKKLKLFGIFIAGFFYMLNLNGQILPEVLKSRSEICFTFHVKSSAEIEELTKIISIDRVDGNQVRAYANIPQYVKFMRLGYEITILPAPGDVTGVDMVENTILSPLTTWNFYPTYENYESIMAQFQSGYPAICNLDTLTTLASGRRLLVLKISDNVNVNEAEPEFLYSSTIHGDETTGYILMLHLADYLLSNYGSNPEATELVNNLEIFICPDANPDGTYYGGNSTVAIARRNNASNWDLNRNYPDPQDGPHPDGAAWQPETVAFMNFANQHHIVAGANFHGGVEVVNYPWDTWATLHADDNWYVFTSREYADTVHLHAPLGYMNYMNNGITNGYAWYTMNGGRQDYMNYYHHCLETTIELSDVKLLPASQLTTHWDYNWRSLILLMKQARYGVHGMVTSQVTGLPVAAKVFISGHDINGSEVYASADVGDYHRLLKSGTYTLEFTAPCYFTQVFQNVVVTDYATTTLNVQMIPGQGVTTAATTAITGTGATSGGNVVCVGTSPVTARGVCWGTSLNPVVSGPHTSDGAGPGTFSSLITGLSGSTLYHVRAYATSQDGTVYGEDVQFSTTCGVVTLFPWTEGFENGGTIPGCWSQVQINNSGLNWTFLNGSGNTHPAAAHSGSYNACLKDNSAGDNKTRLISPKFDLTQVPSPQVKFWHTQAEWSGDQDQLAVYYRTSATGVWTLMATYTSNITAWTQETIPLPNPTSEYYIAFEGNAKYGYGVCVDDVVVGTSCNTVLPVAVSITADANPVSSGTTVTFTAVPVNGGTMPAYQWFVNGVSVYGATANAYAFVPSGNDQIKCNLTSSGSCVSGNPATSNAIVMSVLSVPQNLTVQDSVISSGEITCYNALQSISVAGDGTLFEVQPEGQAVFIAGTNIYFLPGTMVLSGGYLLGYITPSGPFCQQLVKMSNGLELDVVNPDLTNITQGFRIFPNPTQAEFTLESTGPGRPSAIRADLFDLRGKLLSSGEFGADGPMRFTLATYPAGIYILKIFSRDEAMIFRIIRLN